MLVALQTRNDYDVPGADTSLDDDDSSKMLADGAGIGPWQHNYPGFGWAPQNLPEQKLGVDWTCTVEVNNLLGPIDIGNASMNRQSGDGSQRQRFYAPYNLWAPDTDWLIRQTWSISSADCAPPYPLHSAQCKWTWLKLLIAFSLHTGVLVGRGMLDIAAQVCLLRLVIQRIVARGAVRVDGVASNFKRAFAPAPMVSTASVAFGCQVPGIQYRPLWPNIVNATILHILRGYRLCFPP